MIVEANLMVALSTGRQVRGIFFPNLMLPMITTHIAAPISSNHQ
jgi:hypothetical protein